MRTTLTLDADIISAARQIAAAKSKSIGKVISELARRGLEARSEVRTHQGFPVFQVTKGTAPLTPDDVRRDEDEA
jgi:chorismate synthase